MCLYRSSLLVFFRESATEAGLVVILVSYGSIMLVSPYMHARSDILQQVVQTELFILLLAAHTLNASPDSADLLDIVLSLILLAAAFAIVVLFIYFSVLHARQQLYAEMRAAAM